ncbi:MAG: phasin [Azospirillum brasilense]|nr:MAG: phasin [Azospirillum brasilense]
MAIQNPYAEAMKFWSEYQTPSMNMPSFDVSQAVSFGRRNAEAMTAAGQALSESAQAISRRQAELARQHVEKVLKTTKDMLVNGSPEINTTKQVELAKTMFESSLNNLREVSELVTKSGFEVFDVLNKRASESIEEITAYSPTPSKKKSA